MIREIIITREQADAVKRRGLGPVEYIIERFRQDHGLHFRPEDIKDVSRFEYQKCLGADVFKVVYKIDAFRIVHETNVFN